MSTTLHDRSPGPGAKRWLAVGVACCLLLGTLFGLWLRRDRAPSEDGVDVGFLRDMVDHHDQANEMAVIALYNGVERAVDRFATEVILTQRWELGRMYAWLDDWGYSLGDPERTDAMAWMGHAGPVATMAGMQSQENLDRLVEGPEEARSQLFLELMIDHHRGAVHMAEAAAEDATVGKVREFAAVTARNQAMEIREYEVALDELRA
ncbi:MAG: DUF305 domain-containing protein [Acidimicrobiia bacterium]|nr:DUF305 domain-containing protein [Acidimicrobiia bacterium]